MEVHGPEDFSSYGRQCTPSQFFHDVNNAAVRVCKSLLEMLLYLEIITHTHSVHQLLNCEMFLTLPLVSLVSAAVRAGILREAGVPCIRSKVLLLA